MRHGGILLLSWGLLVVSTISAWGRAEFRLGGPQGNTWESLLPRPDRQQVSYVLVDETGAILTTVPVVVVAEEASGDLLRDYGYRLPNQPSLEGNVLQPVLIDPEDNLALDISLAARNGKLRSSEPRGQPSTSVELQVMIDGDPETALLRQVGVDPRQVEATRRYASAIGRVHVGKWSWNLQKLNVSNVKNSIFNLGAELPINRIVFYPRLGFEENYLAWYEIGVADNTAPFVDDYGIRRPDQRWYQDIDRAVGSSNDPGLEILERKEENLDVVVDLRFPTRDLRFIALRPLDSTRDWEIAEIELYGEGFVTRTVYRTDILDFGRPVAWSKIRWKGEQPPGTQILLRTRTGATPQPSLFQRTGLTGKSEPISAEDYVKAFTTGRRYGELQRPPDIDHWSFWSAPYDFAAGLRNPDAPAAAWTDGMPLLSPSPSRYLQMEIVLLADRDRAPRIDELALLFAEEPTAQAVIGEVWPIDIESFEPQTFTYVVRPLLQRGDRGFDRLEIFTRVPADTVRSLKVDGQELIDRFPPEIQPDRLVVGFEALQAPQDNEKRIEVVFDTRVLRFGAEFTGWVYDSAEPDLKQQVRAGNATFRFGGDVLAVSTPMGGDLIRRLQAWPPVFTPNGDGINEQVRISYDLRDLETPRQITLAIFDLSGRRLRQVVTAVSSGSFEEVWDGRDEGGHLVAPGVYLYQVKLDTDERSEVASGTLSVAY